MLLYEYKAEVTNIVDGDTLDVKVDLGFHTFTKIRVRLVDIDTPEIYGVAHDSEEYEAGQEAVAAVKVWLNANENDDGEIILQTFKDGQGKYGRWLGQIFSGSGATAKSLNQYLLDKGFAEEYDG